MTVKEAIEKLQAIENKDLDIITPLGSYTDAQAIFDVHDICLAFSKKQVGMLLSPKK